MSSAASQPGHLRLVGTDDPLVVESWRSERQARQDVIRANRLAAGNPSLEPTDPRWVLAAKTYAHLQGTTLTPERRERLVQTGKRLGLRPFDANVVIAIVQDHARRGEPPRRAIPALRMIEAPPGPSHASTWLRWIAALLCAAMANAILIWWLTSVR